MGGQNTKSTQQILDYHICNMASVYTRVWSHMLECFFFFFVFTWIEFHPGRAIFQSDTSVVQYMNTKRQSEADNPQFDVRWYLRSSTRVIRIFCEIEIEINTMFQSYSRLFLRFCLIWRKKITKMKIAHFVVQYVILFESKQWKLSLLIRRMKNP